MRIRAVPTWQLSYPQTPPFRAGGWTFPSVDFVLVRVETDEGLAGTGWVFTFGVSAARVLRAMVDALTEVVVGEDALGRDHLGRRMWDSATFLGQSGVAVSAMAGIEVALWDLAGRAAGMPLYRLLGGSGAPVLAYASGGSLALQPGDLAEEVASAVERGFRAVKLKIGLACLEEDVARVQRVRETVGPGVKVIADANQRWTPKQALAACERLAEFDLFWLEEPVRADDIEGHARVAAGTTVPVATGETLFTRKAFSALLAADGADVVTPNLQRVGGIGEWLRVAAEADGRGVPIASHVFPEVNAHLLTSIPNALAFEYLEWWPRPFTGGPVLEDGRIRPPDQPGLGLDVDWDGVRRHEVA